MVYSGPVKRKYKAKSNQGTDTRRSSYMAGATIRRASYMKKTSPPSASTAAQAIRTGGWANPTSSGESKFIDVDTTFNPGAGVRTFVGPALVNGIATGTTASTRIGRKVAIKSLLVRATGSIATATKGGSFRILVVYDKQANAQAPAITDVLLADDFNSPNNLSNRDRFVTIFDQIMGPVDVGGPNQVSDTYYKKLNLEQMFNAGTDNTIGSITSGSIYIFVAQSGAMATNTPSVVMSTRVRYTDN